MTVQLEERTVSVRLSFDGEVPALTPAMSKAVQEAVEAARFDHATPLGVGVLSALAALTTMLGRDWRVDYMRSPHED